MNIYEVNRKLVEAIENKYTINEETGEVIENEEAVELARADFNEKCDAYAHTITSYRTEAEAIKQKAKELTERAKRLEKTADRMSSTLQTFIKAYLIATNQKKMKTAWNQFSIRQNAPSVNILDESAIDDRFYVVKKELSKTLIKEAIQNGEDVAGAELVRKESLKF